MMTPGRYLMLRREAAGLSIEDVAAMVHTSPHLGEVDRVGWLRRIEADIAALSVDVIMALHGRYRFSGPVLTALIDARSFGTDAIAVPSICHNCGCSQFDACFDGHATCAWHNESEIICTSCIGKDLPHAA